MNCRRNVIVRKCVNCKKESAQNGLIRLTVDYRSSEVRLNSPSEIGGSRAQGRSAYLCSSKHCVNSALKGNRLKFALEGRRAKGSPGKRSIAWPLEPQLIKLLASECTEP